MCEVGVESEGRVDVCDRWDGELICEIGMEGRVDV